VRLLLTSRDVIHSFYVPSFRIKQDALPGRYTQAWFEATEPGRFQVLCAEYCGTQHSMMLGEIVALEPAEYDAWLAERRRGPAEKQDGIGDAPEPGAGTSMIERGRRAATDRGCFRCHTVDGTPHIGPTWLGLYRRPTRLSTGETIIADESYLTESMMDPLAKLVAGYQPVMPSFRGQLDAPEAAAIVELIKSLRPEREGAVPPQEGPAYEPAGPR
jgi:cytochrome c oxidase subunit 2